ncbi:hypothetical protein acdb102_46790 [Acidothermaceae bacterium B102]|nr:hypothetical protein acdb102_46790 [Acidothermaceae bacterium B102]
MAVIYKTTLSPTKLELLAAWLPGQPWYVGGGAPVLERAGGFRLDDPAGEVGIEFMVVADRESEPVVFYQVPVTYRGAPLDGAEAALIGTSEHGVLGSRWVYDGERDPVLLAQLAALIEGTVEAQAQSNSHSIDPFVIVLPSASAVTAPRVVRVLQPGGEAAPGVGSVSGVWIAPDGSELRGTVAVG